MQTEYIYVSASTSELRVRLDRHETGLSLPVKYFNDLFNAILICGSFVLFMFCVYVLIQIRPEGEVGSP